MVYSQKYPLFWMGNNHKTDDTDKLFENLPVEKNTAEYVFVQRLFNKTVLETDVKIAFVRIHQYTTKKNPVLICLFFFS